MSDKDQDAFKASGTSPTYRLVARVVSIGRSAAGAVLERSRATVAARRRFTEVSSDCEDTAHAEPVKGLNRRAFLKSAGMTAVAGAPWGRARRRRSLSSFVRPSEKSNRIPSTHVMTSSSKSLTNCPRNPALHAPKSAKTRHEAAWAMR